MGGKDIKTLSTVCFSPWQAAIADVCMLLIHLICYLSLHLECTLLRAVLMSVLCPQCLERTGTWWMLSKDLLDDRTDGYGGSGGTGPR